MVIQSVIFMDLKSNEPFWLIKNGLLSSFPSLKTHEKCDVLVIGSGITGSLIAHQCIADGYDTIIVDKREACNGSTSATTSMLQYEIDIPLFKLEQLIGTEGAQAAYKSCSEAIDKLEKLAGLIQSEAGFSRKKSLYYAAQKKDMDWLNREFEARQKAGFEVQWLTIDEIENQFDLQNTFGGILSRQGASIDAFCFTHELLNYNVKKGLRLYDKTIIKSIKETTDNLMIAYTDEQRTITAKKIIYCTGYESKNLIKSDFVKLKSTYAIVSERDDRFHKLDDVLVWNTTKPYLYLRTTDDGRLLIGGEDENFKNSIKRDVLLDKKHRKLVKIIKDILPVKDFYTDFKWAGTFGETKDALPYIGEHKRFKNSYFVLGFGGNGITFSVTGMEMVSLWLQEKPHKLTPYFKFER